MVDRQFFAAGLATAILAHEAISLEYVAPTECYDLDRKSIVARERDDFRNFQCQPLCPDDRIAFGWTNSGPVFPAVNLEIGWIDDPSGFVPNLD